MVTSSGNDSSADHSSSDPSYTRTPGRKPAIEHPSIHPDPGEQVPEACGEHRVDRVVDHDRGVLADAKASEFIDDGLRRHMRVVSGALGIGELPGDVDVQGVRDVRRFELRPCIARPVVTIEVGLFE